LLPIEGNRLVLTDAWCQFAFFSMFNKIKGSVGSAV